MFASDGNKMATGIAKQDSNKRLLNLILAPPAGLEPAPFGLGNRSIRLSQGAL